MAYTTINKPSLQFNTITYSGNGTTQSITNVGFQPDFTWLKCRSTTYDHRLYDVVRGATKSLRSNTGQVEQTDASEGITSFLANGFTVQQGSNLEYNATGQTYVGWNWKANGAGVANTAGTISSTVSANTTSGFSIVKWTGTGATGTIGHGLGIAPKLIILKDATNAYNWYVYTSATGSNLRFEGLNNTNGASSQPTEFTTTSSLITNVTNAASQNTSGANMIAYCFADVKGFSKFGSYTGNGSADGTFVYTGFKPAYVMVKQSNASGEGWFILDNKRETINPMGTLLIANDSGADNTSQNPILDFTSNGFKLRRTWVGFNGSGATYIYMAFAEQPLVGTNNVPATAR